MDNNGIIQILRWGAIILLSAACVYFWWQAKVSKQNLIDEINFHKNDTQYVNISNDKSLKELKKINEELYDSIKHLNNVKEAIQIKYVTKYQTDTVNIEKYYIAKDSLYRYSQQTDTISYDLAIKGKDVEWFNLGFSLHDSLMIVTRSNNGQNETTITHGNNTTIEEFTVYVPKKTFGQKLKEHLYWGVGVGAGYGFINKKPDIYVGINGGIRF